MIAARTPAAVPLRLMPPSVPAGTDFKLMMRIVLPDSAVPTSLDVVSADSSANAASASSQAEGQDGSASRSAATPRFAMT